MISRVACAEHPLVALDGSDRLSDLICKGLEGELMISRGEGRREAIGRTVFGLALKKDVNRFFEMTTEKVCQTM